MRYPGACARQREHLNSPVHSATCVIQRQAASTTLLQLDARLGRGYFGGLVWQDLPGQMNLVGAIGNVNVAIELNALQSKAVPASAAAV